MTTVTDLVRWITQQHETQDRSGRGAAHDVATAFAVIFTFEDEFQSVDLGGFVYRDGGGTGSISPTEFELAAMARAIAIQGPGPMGEEGRRPWSCSSTVSPDVTRCFFESEDPRAGTASAGSTRYRRSYDQSFNDAPDRAASGARRWRSRHCGCRPSPRRWSGKWTSWPRRGPAGRAGGGAVSVATPNLADATGNACAFTFDLQPVPPGMSTAHPPIRVRPDVAIGPRETAASKSVAMTPR